MKNIYLLCIVFLFIGFSLCFKSTIKINNVKSDDSSNGSSDDIIYAFLIPHSHCDVGWVQTYEQYFQENVTLILNNIVEELTVDPTKKFNWAEIIYFESWWNEQTPITQAKVRNLVYNKQLEFIGGGWAQNDEAVTHYQAVINQMTIGHQFLLSTFGVTPSVGWQIDPFGPSTLTATLFSLMGFKYHVINRLDDRLKHYYAEDPTIVGSGIMITNKSFEWNWYPSSNYGDSLSIFTHDLDNHYNSPQLCWPNATNPNISICSGFDFESDPGTNPPINETNINERADLLVEIVKQRQALYRHNNILLPFGNDFRYQNATAEFENMDKLIKYINANSSYGVYIDYYTLSEYFEKVMNDVNNDMDIFPDLYAKDYYTYTMCLSIDYQSFNTCVNYWSGYFTSYPLLKQTIRKSDWLLRSFELLYSLSSAYGNGFDYDFNSSFYALYQHRNTSGILTHHDAVTGTSKWYVRENYFGMLYDACNNTLLEVPKLVEFLLANKSIPFNFTANPNVLVNQTIGSVASLNFFNNLAWTRNEIVNVPISHQYVAVYNSNLESVTSQVLQRMDLDGQWNLYFEVETDPLGISTYFVIFLSDNLDENSRIMKYDLMNLFKKKPKMAHISQVVEINKSGNIDNGNGISIGNTLFNLNFKFNSSLNGFLELTSYDDLVRDILGIPLSAVFIQYQAMSDDAYKFRPKTLPTLLFPDEPQSYISEGPLLSMVTIFYTQNCSMSFIVYNNENLLPLNSTDSFDFSQYFQLETTVAAGWDQEISLRFNAPTIKNNQTFYTNNGIEMMERVWEEKFNDSFVWSLISGNFYPVINTVQINDENNQLTILTQESHGASSQLESNLELLLIRRCNYTQWSIHETLNDTSNPTLRFRVFFGSPSSIETQRTPHSLFFENPFLLASSLILSTKNNLLDYLNNYNTKFSPLSSYQFPMNFHLVSFNKQDIDSSSIIMRVMNIYELNQSSSLSQPISFAINQPFKTYYNFSNIFETTLTANTVINNMTTNDLITLNPIQLKTFIFNLSPNSDNDNIHLKIKN